MPNAQRPTSNSQRPRFSRHTSSMKVPSSLFPLAGALLLTASACAADRYAGLDTAKYLGELRVETTIPGNKPFTEGPAVDADGNVFFTNTGEILKWDPGAGRPSTFRKPSNGANG